MSVVSSSSAREHSETTTLHLRQSIYRTLLITPMLLATSAVFFFALYKTVVEPRPVDLSHLRQSIRLFESLPVSLRVTFWAVMGLSFSILSLGVLWAAFAKPNTIIINDEGVEHRTLLRTIRIRWTDMTQVYRPRRGILVLSSKARSMPISTWFFDTPSIEILLEIRRRRPDLMKAFDLGD